MGTSISQWDYLTGNALITLFKIYFLYLTVTPPAPASVTALKIPSYNYLVGTPTN
jgi:hypothetical protein